ncbi:MAG: hypothetical protein UY72_C0048G0009 [Candidatus Uhrbacteria bacterium GW2011_GWD2_52_7]|uniref:Uncharacterized protein n=1 Tax=Candidatus Uhrbacteria bacterium GW2011_GWD2_52_7 TaxID=1618989 RepID=A0A0G1ZMM1_9BACT|nr:MAG: hypothetical protein UY72_C0048G0009 [Candidatus Uhrbacteria bacterium GW2011_GWD2_52_7]
MFFVPGSTATSDLDVDRERLVEAVDPELAAEDLTEAVAVAGAEDARDERRCLEDPVRESAHVVDSTSPRATADEQRALGGGEVALAVDGDHVDGHGVVERRTDRAVEATSHMRLVLGPVEARIGGPITCERFVDVARDVIAGHWKASRWSGGMSVPERVTSRNCNKASPKLRFCQRKILTCPLCRR